MTELERMRLALTAIIADANLLMGHDLTKEELEQWAWETIRYLAKLLRDESGK
jgi:hypothetical protein